MLDRSHTGPAKRAFETTKDDSEGPQVPNREPSQVPRPVRSRQRKQSTFKAPPSR